MPVTREHDREVVVSKIRAGFEWLAKQMPAFTGSYRVTVHYQNGQPKKLEKTFEEHERID